MPTTFVMGIPLFGRLLFCLSSMGAYVVSVVADTDDGGYVTAVPHTGLAQHTQSLQRARDLPPHAELVKDSSCLTEESKGVSPSWLEVLYCNS